MALRDQGGQEPWMMPWRDRECVCLGCPILGHPDFSRSLAMLGSLEIEASTGYFLLQAGRVLKGNDGAGHKPGITPECPVDWSALQVEHALMEGAKAAGAVISAVVESIRPKPITA